MAGHHSIFACLKGRAKIVKILLENQRELDVNEGDEKGGSPLRMACFKGHGEIVKVLLKWRCDDIDLNNGDEDGMGCSLDGLFARME